MFWENKRGNGAVFFLAVDNLRQDQAVGMRWWSWWCWELWSSYGRQRGRCQTAFPSLSWAFRPTRNILVASISVSFRRSLCSLAVIRRHPLSGCTRPPDHLNRVRLSTVRRGFGCRTSAKAALRRPLSQTVIYGNCRRRLSNIADNLPVVSCGWTSVPPGLPQHSQICPAPPFLLLPFKKKKEREEIKFLLVKSRGFSLYQSASRSVSHLFGLRPLSAKAFFFFLLFFLLALNCTL